MPDSPINKWLYTNLFQPQNHVQQWFVFNQLTIEIENVTIFSGATKMYYSNPAHQSSILRFIGNQKIREREHNQKTSNTCTYTKDVVNNKMRNVAIIQRTGSRILLRGLVFILDLFFNTEKIQSSVEKLQGCTLTQRPGIVDTLQ